MVSLFKFSPLKCGLPVQGVVILAPWDHLFLYRTISLLLSSLYVFFFFLYFYLPVVSYSLMVILG